MPALPKVATAHNTGFMAHFIHPTASHFAKPENRKENEGKGIMRTTPYVL
jgi:hypothetical protein